MWEINAADQLLSVALFLAYGAVSCLIYDILRAARKAGANSFFSVTLGDILFFTVSAFTFFLLLLARTNGQIRGYVLISSAVGFVLCRISLSRLFLPLFTFCFKLLFKISCRISYFISRFCAFLWVFLKKTPDIANNVCRPLKKCLKNGGKVLYNKRNLQKDGKA